MHIAVVFLYISFSHHFCYFRIFSQHVANSSFPISQVVAKIQLFFFPFLSIPRPLSPGRVRGWLSSKSNKPTFLNTCCLHLTNKAAKIQHFLFVWEAKNQLMKFARLRSWAGRWRLCLALVSLAQSTMILPLYTEGLPLYSSIFST